MNDILRETFSCSIDDLSDYIILDFKQNRLNLILCYDENSFSFIFKPLLLSTFHFSEKDNSYIYNNKLIYNEIEFKDFLSTAYKKYKFIKPELHSFILSVNNINIYRHNVSGIHFSCVNGFQVKKQIFFEHINTYNNINNF